MGIYGKNRRVREAAPYGVGFFGTISVPRPTGGHMGPPLRTPASSVFPCPWGATTRRAPP